MKNIKMPLNLKDTYQLMLEKSELKVDIIQASIIDKLQILHDHLKFYETTVLKRPSFFSNFLSKSSKINTPKGLYIYGGVGRGKSMLMDLFFSHAPVALKRRVHFHSFMLEIHSFLHQWRYMEAGSRIALLGTDEDDPVPPLAKKISHESLLLCFDEFQVTDVTDAMLLGRLFTELFDRGVVMVLTSNRIPDDLYKDGLNHRLFLPAIELLKERLQVVALDGKLDYRLERMKGVKTYHFPLNDKSTILLSRAFWQLTDHEVDDRSEVGSEVITAQGRELTIPVASRGVAVVSFKKICGAALGAADYLAIALRYHTVIMVGIPKMGIEKRNEAKRFVILIDALYENNVKFLCCAEVSAEKLYEEGHGHFEFQRTVSRLMEMQSQEYLSKGHAV